MAIPATTHMLRSSTGGMIVRGRCGTVPALRVASAAATSAAGGKAMPSMDTGRIDLGNLGRDFGAGASLEAPASASPETRCRV